MSDSSQPHKGPLHLQRNLAVCTEELGEVLRSAVAHSVSQVHSLLCRCGKTQFISKTGMPTATPNDARVAEARHRHIESSRRMRQAQEESKAQEDKEQERRMTCRFFAIKLNEEAGVVHAFCRRCETKILVYDRDLYWGIKRQSGSPPPTYPYKCSCGGHAFEVAVGLDYPDEALDENDINTITIAVRCVSCGEDAVIYDDEAT
jgi:hypothetical protein